MLKKSTVQVRDVTPGTEEKLRHHLESVVAQANAAHMAAENSEAPEAETTDDRTDDEPAGPDAEMTDRFRSFSEDSVAPD